MNDKITVAIDDSFCIDNVGEETRVYIKKEPTEAGLIWAIYSPEGERMAQTFSREMALAIVRQNDLTATQVH